jgi:hypothetical protein
MRRVASFLLVVLLSACDARGGSPAASVTDSAGVAIVLNSAEDRPLDWSYEVVHRVGGAESGPEAFYHVERPLVAVDETGEVAVLDPQAYRVVRFSPQASVERWFGRQGGGPGELERPIGIAAAPAGGTLVLDAGRGRYIEFDSSGALEREVETRPSSASFLFLGKTLVEQRQEYTRDGYRQYLQLERGSDTVRLATTSLGQTRMYRLEGCGPGPQMGGPVIFGPRVVWHGYPHGLAVNAEPRYVLNMLDEAGRLVRSVRRDLPLVPATREDAEAWAAQHPQRVTRGATECTIPAGEMADKIGFAEFVPAIESVALAWDGSVWVQRYGLKEGQRRIDVFDPSGGYVGTLRSDFPMPLAFMPDGALVLAERDDVDVERLVIARISKAL